ncbi:MAG: hypothetical protein N2450_05575 [bacterium]|nr:hypothetical protein [bacterium]
MKKLPVQLSLFDQFDTKPSDNQSPSNPFLSKLIEYTSDENIQTKQVLTEQISNEQTFLKPSKKELKQQKLLEETNFQLLCQWLKNQLQPYFTNPLEIRKIRGRTRFISLKKEGKIMMLRIHHRFTQAPDCILQSLVQWLKGPRKKPPKLIEQYITELSVLTARIQRNTLPQKQYHTQGTYYDLSKLYNEVNETWFGGSCNVSIGWGRKGPKRARSRHLGSYSAQYHRVFIHPILDSPDVPEFVIRFVIFHELLHSHQPPSHKNPHDTNFRIVERSHPDYERVKQWEKEFFGKVSF